jgi:nucleoside-diphosphate-sugar epimerase
LSPVPSAYWAGRCSRIWLIGRPVGKLQSGHRDPIVVVEHPRARVPRGFRHLFRGREAFRFIRADLARRGSVTSALDRALSQMPRSELSEPRALLHLGALIPPAADRNPDLARAVNVDGSHRVAGVGRKALSGLPIYLCIEYLGIRGSEGNRSHRG